MKIQGKEGRETQKGRYPEEGKTRDKEEGRKI
jgi:hypothetical protein